MKMKPELEKAIKEAETVNEEISEMDKTFCPKIDKMERALQAMKEEYEIAVEDLKKRATFKEESELLQMKKERDDLNKFMDALEIAQEDRERRKEKPEEKENEDVNAK